MAHYTPPHHRRYPSPRCASCDLGFERAGLRALAWLRLAPGSGSIKSRTFYVPHELIGGLYYRIRNQQST
jgi:hypothetical protein